jgi:hypothetical protein
MGIAGALRKRGWALGGVLAFALAVALGGCGSSAPSHPRRGPATGTVASAETAAPATITDTAESSPVSTSCSRAALGALEQVALRVYQESETGRIIAEAVQRLKSSVALAQAVESSDPAAVRRVLESLLLNQIVSVRVTRGGRTLAKVETGAGIAPASGPILNAAGLAVGQFTVAVQGANGYAQTISGLLGAEVVVRSGAHLLSATLRPAPALRAGVSELTYRGASYRVDTFAGHAFPEGPLSVSLLARASAIEGVCERRGAYVPSAAQARADTLGLVAERVYEAERTGSKAELILRYAERSRAFREAVLAGNAPATRAAIIGFFRSHLHIVRVRVIRAGKLLIDVGGPQVLAPIPGVIRAASGRVAAHFELSIQDDRGLQILSQAFTGAQVLMREGTRQVMGTLSPGPTTVPTSGTVVYRGVPYTVYSFLAQAFPTGTLRVSLLFAAG